MFHGLIQKITLAQFFWETHWLSLTQFARCSADAARVIVRCRALCERYLAVLYGRRHVLLLFLFVIISIFIIRTKNNIFFGGRILWSVDMTDSIDRQRGVVVHAVCVRMETSTMLSVSHSAKKMNHRHTVHNGNMDWIGVPLRSVNTVIKIDL